jgi:hypothetical protein
MLASYAGDDHRMFRESREGLIQIPDARGQEPRQRVVHGNIPLTQTRGSVRDRGALGECHDVLS